MTFSSLSVSELSESRREPAWLRELRREAWARAQTLLAAAPGAPSLDDVDAWLPPPARSIPVSEWPRDLRHTLDERGDEEALLVQRDSTVLSRALTKDSAKRGVLFMDLETASRAVPELVQPMLGKLLRLDDYWTALNAAFWTGGSFLYVPEHLAIFLPFHVCYWMSAPKAALFSRNLICVEKGSTVFFVNECLSPEFAAAGLAGATTEVYAGDQATLDFIHIQNWGRHVRHAERFQADVADTATVRHWAMELGGDAKQAALRLRSYGRAQGPEQLITAPFAAAEVGGARDRPEPAAVFEPLLSQLPDVALREKLRHYIAGKLTGDRPETTLQRASELHPEIRHS